METTRSTIAGKGCVVPSGSAAARGDVRAIKVHDTARADMHVGYPRVAVRFTNGLR